MIVKNMDVHKNKQSKSRLNKGKLREREILGKVRNSERLRNSGRMREISESGVFPKEGKNQLPSFFFRDIS